MQQDPAREKEKWRHHDSTQDFKQANRPECMFMYLCTAPSSRVMLCCNKREHMLWVGIAYLEMLSLGATAQSAESGPDGW